MEPEKKYIGVDQVMFDYDVSRGTAYSIIRELNRQLKIKHPNAIIIAGKVNREWYYDACLITQNNNVASSAAPKASMGQYPANLSQ